MDDVPPILPHSLKMTDSSYNRDLLQSTAAKTVDALSDLQQRLAAILLTEHLDSALFASLARIESDMAAVRRTLDCARHEANQACYYNSGLLGQFRALPDDVIARILVGLIDGDPTYQEQLAFLIPDRADKNAKMAGLRHVAAGVP
jgi:hypothetical protein